MQHARVFVGPWRSTAAACLNTTPQTSLGFLQPRDEADPQASFQTPYQSGSLGARQFYLNPMALELAPSKPLQHWAARKQKNRSRCPEPARELDWPPPVLQNCPSAICSRKPGLQVGYSRTCKQLGLWRELETTFPTAPPRIDIQLAFFLKYHSFLKGEKCWRH